ncbi:MAG: hypothetical protein EON91_02930 [Brevundimonas sp.]|uniref:hypothetical protein n=1 Tax=Brevundimonas sp. TaxID=1871086 RepID=UPI001215DB3C|nr:hypothetical protein [Brevundimonas sp.]RZJ18992.1 MAG: hypothetical protein EON91_02930 [Brevundimonas sp.]
MILFGQTFDGVQIAALAGLLATLVLWLGALRNERAHIRWFRRWEADRKARRDAEIAADDATRPGKGPWG